MNNLIGLAHDAGSLNGFGGNEATFLWYEEGAMTSVNLQIAFLWRNRHLVHVGAIFIPNILQRGRHHFRILRVFINFVDKMDHRGDLRAAFINDAVRGEFFSGLEHDCRREGCDVEVRWQFASRFVSSGFDGVQALLRDFRTYIEDSDETIAELARSTKRQ